jgi:hypothetical protein
MPNEWHIAKPASDSDDADGLSLEKTKVLQKELAEFDPIDYVILNNKYIGKASPKGANYDALLHLFEALYDVSQPLCPLCPA